MNYKITKSQNISKNCLVCGEQNEFGLRTRFYETADNQVVALFHPRPLHQSYPQVTHGGISAAVLDEVIGRAIMACQDEKTFGVTVDLSLRYRKPVPYGVCLKAIGRITSDNGRMFEGTGEIYLPNGEVAVSARGKYLRRRLDQITDNAFIDNEWWLPVEEPPEEISV